MRSVRPALWVALLRRGAFLILPHVQFWARVSLSVPASPVTRMPILAGLDSGDGGESVFLADLRPRWPVARCLGWAFSVALALPGYRGCVLFLPLAHGSCPAPGCVWGPQRSFSG